MNTLKFSAVALTASVLALGLAFADGPKNQRLDVLDQNGDGAISAEEFAANSRFFSMQDANDDGTISAEEMTRSRQQRVERHLERFDSDNDGLISLEEFTTQLHRGRHMEDPAAKFTELDLDGNGSLDADELEAGAPKDAHRTRRGPGGDGPDHRAMRLGAHLLHAADSDRDLSLDRIDWLAFLDSADSDSSGTLSRQELEAMRPDGAPEPRGDRPQREGSEPEVTKLVELFDHIDDDDDGLIELREPRHRRGGPKGPGVGR